MSASARTRTFEGYFTEAEPLIRRALTAGFGPDVGREAAAEAMAYGWEHWERIRTMENVDGYLYVVGRNAAKRLCRRRHPPLAPVPPDRDLWVEPGLPAALAGLPERQRSVVSLVHGYGYSLTEAADLLGIAKTTAQNHVERGMNALRRYLGVES